jgi:hypothetical protein
MSGQNRPAAVNRTLLALIGLVLLAAGALTLGTAYGVLHRLPASRTLIPDNVRLASWVPYVVVIAAIVLGLLCLWWLAAQGRRRPKTGTWRLADDPEQGVTVLSAATAVDPLTADIDEYPGVRATGAWLSGASTQPRLLLRVRTEPETNLTELRQEIATHALPRLCQALDLDHLATTIHFEPTATAARVR